MVRCASYVCSAFSLSLSTSVPFEYSPKYLSLTELVYRVALKKPVPTSAVAKSILFLASDAWSGNITGQVLNVDSGKTGKVMWTKEEC